MNGRSVTRAVHHATGSLLSVLGLPRALLIGVLVLQVPALAVPPNITVRELLAKVAERAQQQNEKPPQREFIRIKTTLHLDNQDNVKEKKELTYRMVIIGNALYPRLIRRNGQALSPEEQDKEDKKEADFRSNQEKNAKQDEGNTVLLRLGTETAERFDYTITGREQVNGRMAYLVAVTPKPGLRCKTREERVMARMSGCLWVDESEYEISKLEVRLAKPIHFGIGLLAALNEFEFCLARNRLPDGEWENSKVKVWLQFRILLETSRIRYEETVSPLEPGG